MGWSIIATSNSFGFQIPVATALPGEQGHSPIVQLNFVEWNANVTVRELKPVQEIMTAQSDGELIITKASVLINRPAGFSCTRDDINVICK